MRSRFDPAELGDRSRFRLIDEYLHADIIIFFKHHYFQQRGWIIYLHVLLTFIALAYWSLAGIYAGYPLLTWIVTAGWSIIIMAVIILPSHALIQYWIYRAIGAPLTRFYYSFRHIYALVLSYDFVFYPREIFVVSIVPLLLLNLSIASAAAVWESTRFYFLALLAINIGSESKEFAVMNYYWKKRNRKLYSYNCSTGKSYIFEDISRSNSQQESVGSS